TIVEIGDNGNVCLYAESRVDLIVDINGWFPANGDLTPRNPSRLLDTRGQSGPGGPDTTNAEFVATFDNNSGLGAFDTYVFHREGGSGEWVGDHDRSCGPPDPGRSIVVPFKRVGVSAATEEIYLCRDHLMTSMESVSSYSIVGFSPDQVFNRSESSVVSWDVNVTDLGDRQWWEVVVIPAGTSHVVCHPHIVDPCGADLVDEYAPGSAMFGIGPYAEFQVVGDQVNRFGGDNPCGSFSSDPEGCASKKIRRRFTMTDNFNGTITIDYPEAGRSWTVDGSFPERFEVVFKDHNYTPEKDNNPPGFTWHWDNIVVR
ncbi:hypothetical protein, partial [Ilumatobacter sp.]|uniref:hypothetical protein n=1 Tax=Ilumatobacter sp. TaxID=1967498 RepID=UPI003AF703ED